MGLHRVNRTPCGFCFVIFNNRKALLNAQKLLNGTILDGQVLKVEIDPGFREGRQYGRARSGGQVRDELRASFDVNRGGYGAIVESQMEAAKAELLTPINQSQSPAVHMPPPRLPPPGQHNFRGGNFRGRGRGGRFHPYANRGGHRDFRDRERYNRRRSDRQNAGNTGSRREETRDDPNPRWRRNDSDEDDD
uniref:Nuclear cap-binding protein subunit 2 n=1 Tax=Aplanochytrium stocchinoi TaxID=215587 RepID=A0A7S3PEK5_9STRA|mmetsp:Transcript_7925/g.9417  ORF Transcript_7925/g.9417 Transcript_7925/m.9417 type:complete len:192 (+) Transcript_7925:372-947(+)